MRFAALLALILALPAGVSAKTEAHRESEAHEVADSEHGDDHGELSISAILKNPEFLGTIVNFTVLLLLLGYAIRKKGNPALAARREEIKRELDEAKRLREEAEARHMATKTRLEKLDHEMLEIRAEMVKAGEAERDRIVAQAEEKAARIRRDANFLIDQQMKQLREDLTKEASKAAIDAARVLLESQTAASDQERLANAYLDRLDEVIEERGR